MAFCAALYAWFSIVPAACGGMGDCVKYLAMTRAFETGSFLAIEHPFHVRVLAPFLASRLVLATGLEAVAAFQILNGVSAVAFAIFWWGIARRLRVSVLGFWVVLGWFLLHPLGFRLYALIPASVDPMAYALMACVFYMFFARKILGLWPVMLVALFEKESFVFVALAVMAAEGVSGLCGDRGKRRLAVLSLVLGGVALGLYALGKAWAQSHLFPQEQAWEITTRSTLSYWAHEVARDPVRIAVWLGAFLCATGFFSVLLLPVGLRVKSGVAAFLKNSGKHDFLRQHEEDLRVFSFLAIGAGGYAALGLFAGSDMSRIIFNGNLFALPFCLLGLRGLRLDLEFWRLLAVGATSFGMAFFYTAFFPSAFEYGYYGSKDPVATGVFLAVCLVVMGVLGMKVIVNSSQDS